MLKNTAFLGKLDGPDNFDLATTDTLAHTSGMYSYNKKVSKVGNLNNDSREGR